jgi:hypothetical protein
MARDLSVEVREFVVAAMGAPALSATAAIADDRVYGPSAPDVPGWPFVRTDLPVATPDSDGCGRNASRYTFNVHGFAKGDDERNAAQLGAAIAADLDELAGIIVVAPEAAITDTVWTGTQVFRDTAEAKGWHAVVSVYCLVSG